MASEKGECGSAGEALVKVIDLDVFGCKIVIFVGPCDCVRRRIRNTKNPKIRKLLSRAFDQIVSEMTQDFSVDGTCTLFDGDIYIYLTKRDNAFLVHELVHGTRFLADQFGIHDDHDETRAYISGYVYRKFNEKEEK